MIGNGKFVKNSSQPVKRLDVQNPGRHQYQGQHEIGAEFQRVSENKIRRLKQGAPTEHQAEKAICDHRRDPGRYDDIGLKFRITVKHFRSKQGAGQGGSKNTADPGSNSRGHHDAALAARKGEDVRDEAREAFETEGLHEDVRAIVEADAERRVVVPSAPGKRGNDDVKVTDQLYRCRELAAEGADIILLAVKPQTMEPVLKQLNGRITADQN